MEGVEIPSYFLCPISLQLMKDPVTLWTGITYDRDSIERWIFAGRQNTCPVTRQPLLDCEVTPNHTLRRLIQAWCTVNVSNGVERFPTPKAPIERAHIARLLDEATLPQSQLSSLCRLREIVCESVRNKHYVEATAGAVDFLASIVANNGRSGLESTSARACEEALSILYSLQISEEGLLDLVKRNAGMIESLTTILRRSSCQSRAHATLLLKSMLGVLSQDRLTDLREELFQEIVNVIRDRLSHQATNAALHLLNRACPWGGNRIKSANAGAVHVLIELLLEEPDRRICEVVLVVMEQLCRCADGRAALVGHAAGIPVVAKKILRVSQVASERAVRILHSVAKHSATPGLLQEMLQTGVACKLCLVLRAECGVKTTEKAREILRLHSRVWRSSPCLSPQFPLSYPTAS
ncbi:E3 ubiquitin-protein ligase [Musa troglodytarum]|uniref:U-box domain-containing protein n=1 Tax=Musa troglodytarum TaxID=320322 RepID=A0A9E7FI26_9LILI|nr:E3 ubiquitin-protein ligase [Musa troglodytarum]